MRVHSCGHRNIVTDEAVSDEMISASGAGKVVPAKPQAMAEAMQSVIDDEEQLSVWKNKPVIISPGYHRVSDNISCLCWITLFIIPANYGSNAPRYKRTTCLKATPHTLY